MKDELEALLLTFGYPVRLQGSMSEEESYPPSFFTVWNNSTEDATFYDNTPDACIWDFDINFYSSDPTLANEVPLLVIQLLRRNGFIIDGKGYDVMSDEKSHTGRGMNALYIQKRKKVRIDDGNSSGI